MKDQAVLFPALCGRFYALRLVRKLDHEAELDEVYGFVEDAEQHKNTIHHLQALAMEAEVFGRNGDYSKALEAYSDLRDKYDASTHSQQLVDFYGEDYCAQTIGQSAAWYLALSKRIKALEACDYIEELLPSLARSSDVFLTLYPVLLMLKDAGQAERSLELCRKYFVVREEEEEKEMDFNPFEKLYKPIEILLHLASSAATNAATSTITDYAEWALDTANVEFDVSFNTYTGSIARNADSIMAEICLILASHKAAFQVKNGLLARASSLVRSSMKLTKYMATANAQVKGFAMDPKYKNSN